MQILRWGVVITCWKWVLGGAGCHIPAEFLKHRTCRQTHPTPRSSKNTFIQTARCSRPLLERRSWMKIRKNQVYASKMQEIYKKNLTKKMQFHSLCRQLRVSRHPEKSLFGWKSRKSGKVMFMLLKWMKIVRNLGRNKQRFRSLFTQLRGEGSLLKSLFWMKILKIMKI